MGRENSRLILLFGGVLSFYLVYTVLGQYLEKRHISIALLPEGV